jgi:hypothetical protein
MQRSEIIELANQLSERKGEKVLNLQSLYRFVVQDICKRQRFWWRRIAFNFTAAAATQTFDLTQITTVPAGAMTEILLDEITKLTLILSPNPFQTAEFVPVFDPETYIEMVNNIQPASPNNPSVQFPGAGGRYTLDPSGINVLRIDPLDTNYSAYLVGWAMPNPASDSTNDNVPLIPAWGHNTIVMGLVAKVFRFAYGSKNEKTLDAAGEYEQGIQDLLQRKQFDPNYKLQMNTTEDSSGSMTGAIRST